VVAPIPRPPKGCSRFRSIPVPRKRPPGPYCHCRPGLRYSGSIPAATTAVADRTRTRTGLGARFRSARAPCCQVDLRTTAVCAGFHRKPQAWVGLPKRYDDIGKSAATPKRPALRRLLVDLAAGKVDCVVALAVDRIARSRSDQARLVATLRRHGVTLVTVPPVFFQNLSGEAIGFTVPQQSRRRASPARPCRLRDSGSSR